MAVFPYELDDMAVRLAGHTAGSRVIRLEDHPTALGGIQLAQAPPIRFCPRRALPLPPGFHLFVISLLHCGERPLLL